jgi:hypothetical protein
MEQREITFWSEGLKCAGTLHLPANSATAPFPAIVMGHGTGAVKDMDLPLFVPGFVEAGLAVLTIEYRYWGNSEGEPRHQVLPVAQRQDYHNALTWLAQEPEINANRLGIWGTSGSGAHVLQVAAFDRRVKAVVSQVAGVSPYRIVQRYFPAQIRDYFMALIEEERVRLYQGEPSRYIPLFAPQGEPSIFGSEHYERYHQATLNVPTYPNRVTIGSIGAMLESTPEAFIDAVSPTPLLMIVAEADKTTPAQIIEEVFEKAGEPKKLLSYNGGHYDIYDDPAIRQFAIEAARDWFLEYL